MPLSIYQSLSKIKFKQKSYSFKFRYVTFIGIHIPLIGFALALLFDSGSMDSQTALSILLILTLASTLITLTILKQLLSPIRMSVDAIENFERHSILPTLPVRYLDEAGTLMAKLQSTLLGLHDHIQEKKDLAVLLSNDLRQPFSQMMGIMEIIKLEDNPIKVNAYCNQMIAEGRKSLKFLEYVLEELKTSHINKMEKEYTYLSVCELLNEVVENLNPSAGKKGVSIQISCKCNTLLEINEEELKTALGNVLTNAMKYSFPGGIIEIVAAQKNHDVEISIRDFGVGFGEKEATNLFKRFVQGPSGTQGEAATGYGLFSARKSIEDHRGSIEAKSEGHGKGTEFKICLPGV